MTAKVPLKVHLRLRFQNLGKPRTAGLCGRAAGACDCGPLSCAKIERPPPLEKPSCKVWLFAQDRSREYRQKVTATTPSQTAFHRVFQLLAQMAHVCFHGRKCVRTRLCSKDRTQRHARRNRGRFGWGYHYPRSVPHVLETLRGKMSERQTLPLLGSWPRVLPKNAESLRNSDALMRVAVPRRRGPAGLRNPFFVSVEIAVCTSCAQGLSARAKEGVVSLPSACSVCCRNAGRPLVKMAHLLFSCGQVIIFASSDRTAYKQKYHVRQQAEAQGAYFKYSSKNAFSFPNGMTSI